MRERVTRVGNCPSEETSPGMRLSVGSFDQSDVTISVIYLFALSAIIDSVLRAVF